MASETDSQSRDTNNEKREIGRYVEEVGDTEKRALIGEMMIFRALAEWRLRQHKRQGPKYNCRHQKVPPVIFDQ